MGVQHLGIWLSFRLLLKQIFKIYSVGCVRSISGVHVGLISWV